MPNLILSEDALVLYKGYSSSIDYSVGPKQVVTFTSEDNDIVTIDNKGNIYASKVGTTVIAAVAEDGQTKECLVTVIN
jgi:uncharacterized protein YjdB